MTRPSFTPTEEQRAQIRQLASFGVPITQMGHFIVNAQGQPVSENTLRKYFADELNYGALEANRQIAETLFRKALSGDTTAMIFWLKTRARWTVTDKVELSGPDGQAIAIETAKARFLAELAGATPAARTEKADPAADG